VLSERYSFGWASSAISREVREQGTSFWGTNSLTTYIFMLIVLLINCARNTFTWPHRGIYYTYWPLAAAIAAIEELLFLIILIGKLDLSFFFTGNYIVWLPTFPAQSSSLFQIFVKLQMQEKVPQFRSSLSSACFTIQ